MKFIKAILKPADLPYDFEAWKKLPFSERAGKVCRAWALQGFGAPGVVTLFYVLKIAFYAGGWLFCCNLSTELGGLGAIGHWWYKPEALEKAILWTVLIEVVGLGGASGPLTGRYMPPMAGMLYFLRPGTIKIPLFSKMPLAGGDTRGVLDVVLYAALLFFLGKACLASGITPGEIMPVVVLLPLLGLLDRTIFLAARGDIYFPAAVCFLFPDQAGPALKVIWFAIWFWAAFSKLTPSFSSVVCVMICNSPVLKFDWLKKRLFKQYPEDVRPGRFAKYLSHCGMLVEFLFPIILISSSNPDLILIALIGMTVFHAFIFINLPMAVPLEWNVMMVYGGFVLFRMHPEYAVTAISNPFIIGLFFIVYGCLPVIGNLYPKYVSFLMSMRYYAGTWAYSVWLFKGKALDRIDANIIKSAPGIARQLRYFYDASTAEQILSRAIGFRMMHLPGRALIDLVPAAVDHMEDYTWMDGEFLAGELLGWNFGDGHLHGEDLLESVQRRCGYASGELRVIMVESPELHTQKLNWRIYDAKDGLRKQGVATIDTLKVTML